MKVARREQQQVERRARSVIEMIYEPQAEVLRSSSLQRIFAVVVVRLQANDLVTCRARDRFAKDLQLDHTTPEENHIQAGRTCCMSNLENCSEC